MTSHEPWIYTYFTPLSAIYNRVFCDVCVTARRAHTTGRSEEDDDSPKHADDDATRDGGDDGDDGGDGTRASVATL